MDRNLSTHPHKMTKKKMKSLQTDRDMSIENISLSPHTESDFTKKYKVSELVNKLVRKTKRIVDIYKTKKSMIKNKNIVNKHFGNKITRVNKELNELIEYMDNYNRKGNFIEHSNVNNFTKKKQKKNKKK